MKTALVLATAARRLTSRSVATRLTNTAFLSAASMHSAAASSVLRPAMAMTMTENRSFATKKPIGKPTGDGSSSDSDSEDDEDEEDSDVEEGMEEDDEEDDEEVEDLTSYRSAARAAFTDEDLARFEKTTTDDATDANDDDDDWDEARWGALDSEDWQGFDGDLDAMTEEGVPTWLQSVRDLSAIHQEKRMRAKLLRRAMEEAKMNVLRVRKVDALGRAYGTGRRKTSTARVWIKKSATPFGGTIKINKKDLTEYLVRDTHREEVLKPFVVVNEIGNFDVYATVAGGGLTGQAGALRHGIARALQHFEPTMRPALKKEKLLTRDPRGVERKKPGQKKARKKFQWVKR